MRNATKGKKIGVKPFWTQPTAKQEQGDHRVFAPTGTLNLSARKQRNRTFWENIPKKLCHESEALVCPCIKLYNGTRYRTGIPVAAFKCRAARARQVRTFLMHKSMCIRRIFVIEFTYNITFVRIKMIF